MQNLFRAEWLKIAGNRYATSFLVWIFPAAAFGISGFAVILVLLSSDFRDQQTLVSVAPWHKTMVDTWLLINNEMTRYIIVAFAAVIFAGEFQYGTWKNLITRRARVTMILTKFATLSAFVTVAFVLTTIIVGVNTGFVAAILSVDYGAVNEETISTFIQDYGLQMFITLAATFVATGYAAILAMSTRNIMAAAIGGVILTIGEQAILLPLSLLDNLLGIEAYWVYQFTPSFSLANVSNWAISDAAFIPFGGSETALDWFMPFSMGASLAIIFVWMVGLVALTAWRFSRSDVMT